MLQIYVHLKEVDRENKEITKLANELRNIERDLINMRF